MTEIRGTINAKDKATRVLTWATATTSLGTGLFYAVSAIFFSEVIGLSAVEIGIGLAFAGIAGVLGALAGGYAAAHAGSRRTLTVAQVFLGVLVACSTLVTSFVTFAALATAISFVRYICTTARAALIADAYTGPDRVSIRARLRVVTNATTGIGALLGGVALAVGTPVSFTAAVVSVGAITIVSGLSLTSAQARAKLTDPIRVAAADIEHTHTTPPPRKPRSPFTDPRYLAVAFLVGVNATYFALLEMGVPLWITGHTTAPGVTVSLVLVINTIVVILTQVAASRGTHDVRLAGWAALRGTTLIAISCVAFAVAGLAGTVIATSVLLMAALVMSTGESYGEAGAWGLTFELADPHNQARYQGVAEMAYAAGNTLGPLLISATALAHGTWGWLLLAAIFVLSGIGLRALASRGPCRQTEPPLELSAATNKS
ncbi:MFS transporter [Amycolatopsis sulphurea]|uniref:MFS transporter n=1 Tax=Amycolatopsis sulphurea TaxID=76022 RepID=UPI001474D402|nr:MFS transporter [Amycolatopsis sulphurea]